MTLKIALSLEFTIKRWKPKSADPQYFLRKNGKKTAMRAKTLLTSQTLEKFEVSIQFDVNEWTSSMKYSIRLASSVRMEPLDL